MTIDKRRTYVLVLDIETANMVDDAIAYDVGFAVADKKGNIYETHSYMVAEMFFDEYQQDMMRTAYYAEKLPKYWKDYYLGKRKLAQILTIRRIVRQVMNRYNITEVYAYNANFDKTGLDRTVRYLTQSKVRWFFPYGTEIKCIWHMATQTICQQKMFARFASKYNLLSGSGNVSTSAETVYKYITNTPNFEESHTGLEDVQIETAIMAHCFRQHKKMDRSINRGCWKLPQENFKRVVQNA